MVELSFLCTVLHDIATNMHTKFKVRDDKVVFQTSNKCCKKDNLRKIAQRHHKVDVKFWLAVLLNIATNKHNVFSVTLLKMTKLC